MYVDTYKEYIGYYYEFAGRKYVGKEFSINAPELIEISSSKINPLLNNPSTFTYGTLSEINLPQNIISSIPYSDSLPDARTGGAPPPTQFYCKKANDNTIKEINEQTYKSLQDNPLYITTFIGNYKGKNQNANTANEQLSGLESFLIWE